MKNALVSFMQGDTGATAIEYGLIAAIIAIGIIMALINLRIDLVATFGKISAELKK
jgi:pilus assembly protein Flp/PilA